MKLRCYCCGTPIEGPVALVTQDTKEVDRVFVMLPEHKNRVDGGSNEVVERAEHVKDLVDTILDFMPNVGKCALQDYGRLNRVLLAHPQPKGKKKK